MKKQTFLLALALLLAGCQESGRLPEEPALTDAPMLTDSPQGPTLTGSPEKPAPSDTLTEAEPSTKAEILEENVEYEQAAVDGLTRVGIERGKGIRLDLNGDGTEELLYFSPKGIYINGILEKELRIMEDRTRELWLVDVDTADSYLNFIVAGENDREELLLWYDGSLKAEQMGNFNGNPFSTAEYRGDGIVVVDSVCVPLLYESCFRPAEYQWSAELGMEYTGKASVISREPEDWEELADPEDGQWRLLTDWKLYQDSRLDAEIIQGKKQQKLYPLKVTWKETEGNWQECWILVELENGAQGWIYAEWTDEKWILNREKDAREVIEGYSSAG